MLFSSFVHTFGTDVKSVEFLSASILPRNRVFIWPAKHGVEVEVRTIRQHMSTSIIYINPWISMYFVNNSS